MQTNTNNIRVSMFPELVRADMKVTQNDIDTNEVIVRVFDQSDVEVNYSTITSAMIIFTKPDYHVVQGNMTVRENDLYYKMGTNEIAVKGDVKAQIQLVGSNGERLTIGGFSFTVQSDPVTPWTVQSSSEYGILHSLIVEAQAAINNVEALSVWENYDSDKEYVPMNKVVYNGSCYINLVACQGVLPTDTSKWLRIASRGTDATIQIGEVTTGLPGSDVSITNTGVPTKAIFNFEIPRGDKGDPMKIDVIGPLSEKSLYDNEPHGFSFLATDTGDVYFKLTSTSGHWSEPIAFRGHGVPAGGIAGQFLKKNTSAEGDTSWSNLPINNTLTSTSTTEALSAAQGKALKDAADSHEAENMTDSDGVHGLKIEEGSWTPVIEGSTVAGTNTYSLQVGEYYKVGKKVRITFSIEVTAKDPSMSGGIRIGGIPFNIAGPNLANGGMLSYMKGWTATSNVTVLSLTGDAATKINLMKNNVAGGNSGYAGVSELGTGFTLRGTIDYITN